LNERMAGKMKGMKGLKDTKLEEQSKGKKHSN
jgi:hypothetical protein